MYIGKKKKTLPHVRPVVRCDITYRFSFSFVAEIWTVYPTTAFFPDFFFVFFLSLFPPVITSNIFVYY
jgi:hypothetical protein